jgi:hypothetical protein
MIENIPANDKQYPEKEAEIPEKEAEIRVILKVKQNSDGSVTGYVYSFDVNNYEGLLSNATQLVREYDFQYATDKMIEVTIDHVLKARA